MIESAFIVAICLVASGETATTIEVLTPLGEWVRATTDDGGTIRDEKGADIGATALAWSPISDEIATVERPPISMTKLSDGQVIIGSFGGFHDGTSGQVVRWKHLGMGLMDIPIERTAFIQIQPMTSPPLASDFDEIVLRNGDRITGFIESFGEPIVMESAGKKLEIPTDRVAGVSLVSTSPAVGAVRVWLADGSVIDGSSFSGGFGGAFVLRGMSLVNGRSTLPLLTEEIRCIAQAPKRIIPLARLKPRVSPPTTTALPRAEYPAPKVSATDAPFGASAIEIRGPVGFVYEIPQGFSILIMQAEIPQSVRAWGDCGIVIRQNGRKLGGYSLSAKSPSVQIRVAVEPGPLEIEIEEASGGPIGDTVVLRRAILIATDNQK